jgi:cyclic-di-GMP-binding protein
MEVARAMPSFDVVSELDMQEVRNAVDQVAREISQRFDFKGTDSSIELKDQTIEIHTESEPRLQAMHTVLEERMVKRKVSLKALDYGTVEEATKGTVRQTVSLRTGINDEKARTIGKFIKGLGIKGVQHQIQGDQLRVTGKKRDALQDVIAALKAEDFELPLQFTNFRD